MPYIMIYYIYFIWLVNIVFMCILMLNLLVAILSSAYEDALTDNYAIKYSLRCQMIHEATMIKETFKWTASTHAYIYAL